jgi:hypothetical protein
MTLALRKIVLSLLLLAGWCFAQVMPWRRTVSR